MKKIILIIACFFLHQKIFCWGFYAHRSINEIAIYLLPPEMLTFYFKKASYLKEHATDADKRRYIVAAEACRHYIDLDHYGNYPFDSLPRNWKDAAEKYSIDTLFAHGIVPWRIVQVHQNLTEAFIKKNSKAILKLSADLGHYIADAHVPLHTSSNHNGQKTNQHGIHAFWESRIPELFAESEWNLLCNKAEYIKSPLNTAWQIVLSSAKATDSVLSFEAQLTKQKGTAVKYAYEWRNQQLIRQYSFAFSKEYNQALNGMVERRMKSSIHMVASYWYTAWINAGQPSLEELISPIDIEMAALTDSLDNDWQKQVSKGHICPEN
jgi:hypothetical protein